MIKAIIFDMVGPLLQKDPRWIKVNTVDTAESLWSKSRSNEDFLRKLSEDPEINMD